MFEVQSFEVQNPWPTLVSVTDFKNVEDLNMQIFFACKQRRAQLNIEFLNANNATLFFDFPEEICKPLEDLFRQGFLQAFQNYGRDLPEWSRDNILDTFVNLDPQGGGVPLHSHTGSIFVAVYYVQALPNEGILRLFDSRWAGEDLPWVGNFVHEVKPQSGRMVVFPGNLWHEVKSYLSTGPRICIGSNYKFVRSIIDRSRLQKF